MTAESRKVIENALEVYRGDDYERASHAFRNFSPTEMQKLYGESGCTRQQIVDSYRNRVTVIDKARQELEGLLEGGTQ